MGIGLPGNLRMMGYAEHLAFAGQVFHNDAYLFGCFALNTGIYFIKDEGGQVERLGYQRFNAQH